jgi:hypothetical protein
MRCRGGEGGVREGKKCCRDRPVPSPGTGAAGSGAHRTRSVDTARATSHDGETEPSRDGTPELR